ncbi:MAG: exo-alpha-sialidase [Deltaproteobacteria bacterium]|nr:MAG: exo-alpha-sialidase [Deltaproteobacteria bacterium]
MAEAEGGPFTVAEEKYLNRAWPGDEVPLDASLAAPSVFREVASRHDDDEKMDFNWQPLGPTNAFYPAILGRTGAPYVSSGRITDLAIDPNCGEERCRLWLAAAGGGVWRTDKALSDEPKDFNWKWISGPLGSNAIGSLLVDPNDGSGNTLYVGTGEPNASVDSEAGVGIYKSTDGGDTWTLLPAVATVGAGVFPNFPKGRSVASLAIDPAGAIYVALARGIRGLTASDGGGISTPPPPQNPAPLGLYKSTDGGKTFSRIWNGSTTLRGVIEVRVDPRDGSVVYASAFQVGIWRSDGGAPFAQIFMPTSPAGNTDRTQFALTVKDGHTRIYAGDGSVGRSPPGFFESQVWRADTAEVPAAVLLASQTASPGVPGLWKKLTRSAVADPGYATYNFCTGQCWYDNAVVTPPGHPDTVFVLGSFQYNESFTFTNARAVLRSLTAGEPDPGHNNRTFTDQTFDATSATTPNSIHPDQHAIVFVPGRPGIWFEGSDGGLMRASGRYVDASAQCDSRSNFDGTPLTPDQRITCKRLLSSIPSAFINMNFGLNTIQFQMLSAHPTKPRSSLLGGTQDNGTFAFTGSRVTWKQTGGGDGGFSGYNVARPNFRLRTNFGQHVHGTRKGNDPAGWYHIGGPILFSPEGSYFYMPIIYDPSPKAADTIFAGSQGVWRTQDNGGNPAFLEANCQSLSTGEKPTCGDFVELGGAAGDLTDPARGTRPLGGVSVVARTPSDTNTLWAATGMGRVFISTNADGPAAAVTYHRLDTFAANSPPRFVSGIVVDPHNSFHAWISYGGYSGTVAPTGAEPNKPGHVFEIDYDGVTATWVPIDDGTGPMGDLPVDSIARDDATGDLFVSTDFGVLRQPAGTTHWHMAGSGLPPVEVPYLTLSQSGRVLYAATHGRGGYRLLLRGASDDDRGGDDD